MHWSLYLLITLALLIGLFCLVVSMRPAQFAIERSATFDAAPADVFAHVNDLRRWAAWSPWERRDPQMKRTYEGPPEGTGAVYKWAGNKQVGEGMMTITASKPHQRIEFRLQFIKPFAATNTTAFTFTPAGEQTTVTWTMTGENNFMSKAFSMFIDMDKMIGKDFEQGLGNLKSVVQSQPASDGGAV